MRILTLSTPEEKAVGLQYRRFIEHETLWVFEDIGYGDYFHSENVPEPFDLAFVDENGRVIAVLRMTPPNDRVMVPEGTAVALESKAGEMARWGIVAGTVVSL